MVDRPQALRAPVLRPPARPVGQSAARSEVQTPPVLRAPTRAPVVAPVGVVRQPVPVIRPPVAAALPPLSMDSEGDDVPPDMVEFEDAAESAPSLPRPGYASSAESILRQARSRVATGSASPPVRGGAFFRDRQRAAGILTDLASAICLRPGVDAAGGQRQQAMAALMTCMTSAVRTVSTALAQEGGGSALAEGVARSAAALWSLGQEDRVQVIAEDVASYLRSAPLDGLVEILSESPPIDSRERALGRMRLAVVSATWALLDAVMDPSHQVNGVPWFYGNASPLDVAAKFQRPIHEAAEQIASTYDDPETRILAFSGAATHMGKLVAAGYRQKTREFISWIDESEDASERALRIIAANSKFDTEIQAGMMAYAFSTLALINEHASRMARSEAQSESRASTHAVHPNQERDH